MDFWLRITASALDTGGYAHRGAPYSNIANRTDLDRRFMRRGRAPRFAAASKEAPRRLCPAGIGPEEAPR